MAIKGDEANVRWTVLLGEMGTCQLPGDLMVEILGRLPLESIFQFKSVCRAWYALFRSPVFQHQSRIPGSSAEATSLLSSIIHTRTSEGHDELLSLLIDDSYANPIRKTLCPSFEYDGVIQVAGSINGLVCLSLGSNATSIVLWNPAIREYPRIPDPRVLLESEAERVSLGFAYDQNTNSYKVIRVLYSRHLFATMRSARVEVYNTRTHSWRTMQVSGFPWLCYQITCSTLVGGIPYWYAIGLQEGTKIKEVMAWFDASDESFRFHPLPCYHDGKVYEFRIRLGVMGDHPIVIAYSIEMQQKGRVEIWKLNKRNEGDGSELLFWNKVLTVEPGLGVERVVGCCRNGEIIAESVEGALFIHDPHTKQKKEVLSCGSWGFLEVYGYTASLVVPSRFA